MDQKNDNNHELRRAGMSTEPCMGQLACQVNWRANKELVIRDEGCRWQLKH